MFKALGYHCTNYIDNFGGAATLDKSAEMQQICICFSSTLLWHFYAKYHVVLLGTWTAVLQR